MNINIYGWDWLILVLAILALLASGIFHGDRKKYTETHWDFFKEAFFTTLWLLVLYLAGTFS